MKPVHWVLVGMFLTGLASQLNSLHTWHEMASPSGVAGVCLNLGGIILALFSEKPNGDPK